MTQHQIRHQARGRVGVVSFDHSARHNCFTEAALADLVAELEAAAEAPGVALVRLEMAGQTFCSGWDTREFSALSTRSPAEVEDSLRENDRQLARIRNLPVPVVAAVRGHTVGFGVGLLASIHLPIMADDATASLPEVAYGISPGGVLTTILDLVPAPAAHRMLLTGDRVDAAALLAWGLVAEVVPPSALETTVAATVEQMHAFPGPVLRTVMSSIGECSKTGTSTPAYAAAARSIVALAQAGEDK